MDSGLRRFFAPLRLQILDQRLKLRVAAVSLLGVAAGELRGLLVPGSGRLERELPPLSARWPHVELYLRDLEHRGLASATVSRRLSTLAGLFKYAVLDELVTANPTLAVGRAAAGAVGKGSAGQCSSRRSAPPS